MVALLIHPSDGKDLKKGSDGKKEREHRNPSRRQFPQDLATAGCGAGQEGGREDSIPVSDLGNRVGVAHGDMGENIGDGKVIFFQRSWGR